MSIAVKTLYGEPGRHLGEVWGIRMSNERGSRATMSKLTSELGSLLASRVGNIVKPSSPASTTWLEAQ
jgi:hypothetical protein